MRPYTVCHLLCSIDGNISGSFFKSKELEPVSKAFAEIRDAYDCSGYIYGSVTVKGTYADLDDEVENEDNTPSRQFFFDVNPQGLDFWKTNTISKRNFKNAKIVEIFTEQTPRSAIERARGKGIDYIIAGDKAFDPKIALEKIYSDFGVKRLMISGGGILDWSFLENGLIDEVSIVIAPLTDGATGRASIFDKSEFSKKDITVAFDLIDANYVDGGGLWIRYKPKNG